MKTKTATILYIILMVNLVSYSQSWTPGSGLLYSNPTTTKVGIGITNPTELVQVNGGALKIGNTSSATDRTKNLLKFGDGNYVQIGEWESDNTLSFKASRYNFMNSNGVHSVKIDENGKVGIGGEPGWGNSILAVYGERNPAVNILSPLSNLEIGIATNEGAYAVGAMPGNVVLRTRGATNSMIFSMGNNNNDGQSFIGVSDGYNGLWAKFQNNRVLYVDGTTVTKNLLVSKPNTVTNWDNLWQSGFYESSGAANAPEADGGWFWGINMGHSSNSSSYKYGGQIAIKNNSSNPEMFFRATTQNGTGTWRKVLYSGINENVGIGTDNPRHKLEVTGTIAIQGEGNVGPTLELFNRTKTGNRKAMYWRIFNMTGEYGNSLQFWAYDERNTSGDFFGSRFTITDEGNIGIGTGAPGTKLDVIGGIRAHEVKVCLNQGCDFVFEPDYKLMPLNELDQFITTNRHLPEVAPAAVMESEGIDLAEMNAKLLQKIEELTLYVIDLNNQVQTLKSEK